MQIEVTTRHGTVSNEVRHHIVRKAEKLLTYFERVTAIQVTIDFENTHVVRVEILVDAEHKHDFVATHDGDDVIGTFDGSLHKMEQQIKKYKERIQDHRRDRPLSETLSPKPDAEGEQDETAPPA